MMRTQRPLITCHPPILCILLFRASSPWDRCPIFWKVILYLSLVLCVCVCVSCLFHVLGLVYDQSLCWSQDLGYHLFSMSMYDGLSRPYVCDCTCMHVFFTCNFCGLVGCIYLCIEVMDSWKYLWFSG